MQTSRRNRRRARERRRIQVRSAVDRGGLLLAGLLILAGALALASSAAAQQATTSGVAPSVTDLKARAYDAQEAAGQAQAAAERASAAADAAQQAVDAAAAAAASSAASAPAAVPAHVLEDLHRAPEEAKNAAAAARAATAAVAEHVRDREKRYSRSGFYLSGGIFYAPELFDTSLSAGDSRGAFGAIGYHFAERFDVEVRVDALDNFGLTSPLGYAGHFRGYSVTANAKLYILTKAFQPYLGIGLGALRGETKFTEIATGRTQTWHDTVGTFRLSAGFDYYVSESVALTGDAAVNMPGGELSSANFATLGGGLKIRF